ncbi:MAG: PQQ-binding-like beta-propeller repeat protein [Verrucomicrobia bacterium]|nr:PQQ-binding-like beta-propeller repeat protein [Verrucomicrobiota bacterium]
MAARIGPAVNARCVALLLVASTLVLNHVSLSGDWNQWLGPNRDAISTERGAQRLLSNPVRLWTNAVGAGVSSLVVSRGKVFAMGHTKGRDKRGTDTVFCLAFDTGKILWRHSYDCRTCVSQDVQFDGPRSTPTVDGDRLYTLSLEGHLFCLESASGDVVWSRQLVHDFGGRIPIYGYCCSPLVYRNLLLLELNAPGVSHVALDKNTGELVWEGDGLNVTCASPVLTRIDDQDYAVFLGSDAVLGVDPLTGRTLWRHGTWGHAWMGHVVHSNLVFVANASLPRGCGLIRIESGKPRVVWEDKGKKFQTLHSNAVIHEGCIYGVDNTGTDLQSNDNNRSRLKCIGLETGEEKWVQDRFGWSNLILFDGKLLIFRQVGELVIADATPSGYQETARHALLDGRSWTVPALADGRLFLRNNAGAVACYQLIAP